MNLFWIYQGKQLAAPLEDYTVIDVETTGLKADLCEMTEISGVRVRGHKIVAEFSSLIHPLHPIPDNIVSLTGISNEMVKDAPELEEVLPAFLDWLGDDILVGQNIPFDISFLLHGCRSARIEPFRNDYEDTLSFSRLLLPEMPHHRLNNLCDHFGIVNEQAHRSLSDCRATYAVYRSLCALIEEKQIPQSELSFGILHLDDRKEGVTRRGYDRAHPLYGKRVVFTGSFKSRKRRELETEAAARGAVVVHEIGFTTDFLFYGEGAEDSIRFKKAELLKEQGAQLKILNEDGLLELLA
ncbi:MAG: hypothetical protein IKF18_07795 [Erysipelotrichaceae bacterium]|nr:hypothetical protein [Erysipelotrichaceae bacterium]